MEGEWPLIGRTAELERVDGLLRRGAGGVVLAGPAGVGKTRLAGECLGLPEQRGFVPVRVSATQAAASLPFGAFALLLPELPEGLGRSEFLGRVGRAVIAQGDGKRVALLVDDAHLLDAGSAALTHQLAASDEVFVIATVRSGEPASDAVTALWKDGLAERVELAPLALAQVEALLAALLAGAVEGATAAHLFERSGGNVLFLKELVISSLEEGALRREHGLWRLEGPLPSSARLVELVELRLAGLAAAERAALEVLALAEPLGVHVLQGIEPDVGLQDLERRKLVVLKRDGRRIDARVAHPVYGDIVRAGLSPLRARSLYRRLAGTLAGLGSRRREDALRVATWILEGGGELEPEGLSVAAHQAYARQDFALARRLATAAREAGAGIGTGVLAAQMASYLGGNEAAEAEFVHLMAQASSDDERGFVAVSRLANLTLWMNRYQDAGRLGEELAISLADSAWDDDVAANRALVAFYTEGVRAAAELADPLRHRAKGQALVWACVVAGMSLPRLGRFAEALDAAECGAAAYAELGGVPGLPPGVFAFLTGETLISVGRLREAESLVASEYERAVAERRAEDQEVLAWSLGRIMLSRGRPIGAARYTGEAVASFQRLRPDLLRWALAILAWAFALQNRAAEAVRVLAEHDAVDVPYSNRSYIPELLRARAWTAVAAGQLSAARDALAESIRVAEANGDLVSIAAALHDLARLGRAPEVSNRLAEVAVSIEDGLVGAQADHASALSSGDCAALDKASDTFETMGADLLAAEAAADAAVAWRKAGDPRKAAAAERRAHTLAERCEGARTPALAAVTARAVLSPRELEIVRLAAAGVANKEIAARLYLSLHTVQNKLHTAYEKLGVDGRAELAEALEGY